jgi:hypothetical protein
MLVYWRRAPRDSIEAIKSSVRLDSDDAILNLVESRIKSSVRLNSVYSNNDIINLIILVNHDY